MSGDSYVGAVPVRAQLGRLDRLVAAHETYWPAVAQQNPQSTVMRDFLRRHWDPWFTRWAETRQRLDQRSRGSQLVPASDEAIASFVREAAGGLSAIRQIAADNRIPTPDLGTSRAAEGPRMARGTETYNKVTEDAVRGSLTGREFLAEGERDMSAYNVGADGQSYPEVAAAAVRSVHAQHRSPFYGYVRSGINQKIYLFPRLDDASAWFSQHVQLQPDHDYAAVFSAANLRGPIAGMEHFMRTTVGCVPSVGCDPNVGCDPQVGSWWPFFSWLAGGVGGYALRRWQEPDSAKELVPSLQDAVRPLLPPSPAPKASGDPYVGGPWLDLVGQSYGSPEDYVYSDGYGEPYVGGPWLDIVGAQAGDRRGSWPQTKALIQSAISDVTSHAASYPAEAYVWTLDAPARSPYGGSAPGSVVTLEGTTNIVPFSSQGEALAYLREVAQTRPVALAMFERSSTHWPNPTAWRKSDQPEHESVIAQHVASRAPTQMGAWTIGQNLTNAPPKGETVWQFFQQRLGPQWTAVYHDLASQAGELTPDASSSGGYRQTTQADYDANPPDPKKVEWWRGYARPLIMDWIAFRREQSGDGDDARGARYIAWANRVQDLLATGRESYRKWEALLNAIRAEAALRGFTLSRPTQMAGTYAGADASISAALDDVRRRAQTLADKRAGTVIGVIHTSKDGLWHTIAFRSADDADDWLNTATQDQNAYTYAAYFDKTGDSWPRPYVEKIGGFRESRRTGTAGWAA